MNLRQRYVGANLSIAFVAVISSLLIGWAVHARNDAVHDQQRRLQPGQIAARDLLAAVVDQETGERGYIITGDAGFLAPYTAGRARSPALLTSLGTLFRADPDIARQVGTVATALTVWQDNAEAEIALGSADPPAAQRAVAAGRGKELLDRFRGEVATLETVIDRRMAVAAARQAHAFALLLTAIIVGGLASLFVAFAALRRSRRWVEERTGLLETERQLRIDRAAAADAARDSAALLDALIDESPIGIAFFDLDGRYERINKSIAEDNGVSIDATIGRRVSDVVPDLANTVEPMLRRVADTRTAIRDIEVVGTTPAAPDLTRQWLAGFYPVEDAAGELIGVGVATLEISRLRAVEARLRSIIASLQASLMPTALPVHPDFDVAVEYRSASEETDIGGDFYDVGIRPDGSLAVSIGDVCGHDIDAAVLTGAVRHTMTAAAEHLGNPAEVLRWANRTVLTQSSDGRFVTAAHAQFHSTGETTAANLTVALAGHPYPIVIPADGGEAFEIGVAGSLLGIGGPFNVVGTRVQLDPGDQIVFYTDGLHENSIPRLTPDDLRSALHHAARESAAETLAEVMRDYDSRRLRRNFDDVAVLIVQRRRQARDHPPDALA